MLPNSENNLRENIICQDISSLQSVGVEWTIERFTKLLEERIVEAVWTLRRLPDGETKWLMARSCIWPETASDYVETVQAPISDFKKRIRIRPTPHQIDRMQPSLDLLTMLPDLEDRRLLFWAAWHQHGEVQSKIPWVKIGKSCDLDLSRWTLKRRYRRALDWLAAIILS